MARGRGTRGDKQHGQSPADVQSGFLILRHEALTLTLLCAEVLGSSTHLQAFLRLIHKMEANNPWQLTLLQGLRRSSSFQAEH